MGIYTFMILWCVSSLLNVWIFQWGKQRLAKAFHGGDGSPLDGFELAILILLSPFGPLGVLLNAGITHWWCSGFEGDKESNYAPRDFSNKRYSRAKRLALKRAGWSEQEILAQFGTGAVFTAQDK